MTSRFSPEIFPRGIFSSSFRPAWWLRNAHAQTLFSSFFRKLPDLPRERETLALSDGDFLDLDWYWPAIRQAGAPIVLIVHGLSGSSESHYVLGLQVALAQKGWISVALNCRGASGRPNNLPRAYHAGSSDDLLHALHHVQARFPDVPVAAVGYSLGGNMVLKMLGEQEGAVPVFAAVAVSVPFMLSSCADRMDRGFSRVYRRHFMTELTGMWKAKLNHFERLGDMAAVDHIRARLNTAPFRSFWQFDNDLMAPLHGFRDVHDYYFQASSRKFLAGIQVPTLVIQAQDDPFMSPDILPSANELSRSIHFELSMQGGHVGFIEGGEPRVPRYYLERKIPEFLQYCLEAGVPGF